ncbi:hypothetical protein EVG20_g3141 [Dentipellis fragilis]|uniref:Uncharacterized protein n=1 Tax=Dentipellis fragilis TaxID=205917 RepID=A0A4Y9Z5W7_9AGAM|nr:hypothetical protein EVG20_g3141 [Dentipellis fragilis]
MKFQDEDVKSVLRLERKRGGSDALGPLGDLAGARHILPVTAQALFKDRLYVQEPSNLISLTCHPLPFPLLSDTLLRMSQSASSQTQSTHSGTQHARAPCTLRTTGALVIRLSFLTPGPAFHPRSASYKALTQMRAPNVCRTSLLACTDSAVTPE